MLGSGYLVTWARLRNEGLPTRPVLSALGNGYYVGVALESLWLSVFVIGGVAAILFAVYYLPKIPSGLDDARNPHRWPSLRAWSVFGLSVALVGACFAGAPPLFNVFRSASASYVGWTLAVVAVAIGLSLLVGVLGRGWTEKGIRRVAAVVIVIVTLVAVCFKVVDALFRDNPLPEATVALAANACHDIPEAVTTHVKRTTTTFCSVRGFYLAESDKWVYVVQRKTTCSLSQVGGPSKVSVSGQLVSVPRNQAMDVAITATGAKPKTPCAAIKLPKKASGR